jgi:GrpB-like predicted nucleotidyltransferase (UPF0157 family)
MTEPIVIVDYSPRWPGLFEHEKEALGRALAPYVLSVEHIGSTAVPGLAAKATIDLMAGIFRLGDAPHCIPRVVALGYTYSPELEAEFPQRRYFSKEPAGGPKYHVHMVEVGSPFWERHLLFRDWLRAHPRDAAAYAALKRKLAAKFKGNRRAYTDAKAEFILKIEKKARAQWAKGPSRVSRATAAGEVPHR